jgi:predicted GNAT family N-acyltransferase
MHGPTVNLPRCPGSQVVAGRFIIESETRRCTSSHEQLQNKLQCIKRNKNDDSLEIISPTYQLWYIIFLS